MRIGIKAMLRAKFALIILVPAIVTALVGLVSVTSYSHAIASDTRKAVALAASSGLQVGLNEFINIDSALSRMDAAVQTAIGNYAAVADVIQPQMTALIDNSNGYLLDIVITDANGYICADFSGRETGAIYEGFEDEMLTLGKNDSYTSDITVNNEYYGRKSTFSVGNAIRQNETNIGYVIITVNAQALSDYISNIGYAEGGDLFIADRNNTTIGFGDTIAAHADDLPQGLRSDLIPLQNNRPGGKNDSSLTFTGNGYTGYYGGMDNASWLWVAVDPDSAYYGSVPGLLAGGLIAGGTATLLMIALMLIFTGKAINPLGIMIERMKAITTSDTSVRFNVEGSDEYASMAYAFNTMLDSALMSEELHRTVSQISDNMLFEWDFRKERMFASANLKSHLDININSSTLLNGKFIDSLMSREEAELYKREINKMLKNLTNFSGEFQVKTKPRGDLIWISLKAQCVCDRRGDLLRVVGVITNIDSEKKLNMQLQSSASYDFLSQLYNRPTFDRELTRELTRTASPRLGIIFVDVDDFKNINDKYGHSVGDEVLKHVSTTLKTAIGANGFACRFGGDEFVACLTDPKAIDTIAELGERMMRIFDIGYRSTTAHATIPIKISIGISFSPEHGKDGMTLVAAADEAMYYVKKNGKSGYHIYNPAESNLSEMGM
jgi:diguanylate cyclase (GGDEF)-like protein